MRLRLTILTCLPLFLPSALLTSSCGWRESSAPPPPAARATPSVAAPPVGRRVYPSSVVSGGLTTQTDMKDAVQQDRIVRSHYADLRPTNFRPHVLPNDHQGYVSYRVRDKIFWSRRLMTIKKGETVLTDGKTMLRGRCGNRISPVPMEPTAPPALEPAEAVLDSSVESRRLESIPPVPSPSPIDTTLSLVRPSATEPSVSPLVAPPPQPQLAGSFSQPNTFAPFGVWAGGSQPGTGGFNGGTPAPETPAFPLIAPPLPSGVIPGAPPGLVPAPPAAPSEWIELVTPQGPILPLSPMTPVPPPTSPIPGNVPSPFPPGPPTTPFSPSPVPGPVPPTPTPGPTPGPTPPPPAPPPAPPPSDPPPFGPPIEEVSIPEPSALLLVLAGLALFGAKSYRDRRRA